MKSGMGKLDGKKTMACLGFELARLGSTDPVLVPRDRTLRLTFSLSLSLLLTVLFLLSLFPHVASPFRTLWISSYLSYYTLVH